MENSGISSLVCSVVVSSELFVLNMNERQQRRLCMTNDNHDDKTESLCKLWILPGLSLTLPLWSPLLRISWSSSGRPEYRGRPSPVLAPPCIRTNTHTYTHTHTHTRQRVEVNYLCKSLFCLSCSEQQVQTNQQRTSLISSSCCEISCDRICEEWKSADWFLTAAQTWIEFCLWWSQQWKKTQCVFAKTTATVSCFTYRV